MSEKEKQRKGDFLVKFSNILTIGNVLHCLILFLPIKLVFCICFFNCQSCKCGQLSQNYIKRDLGDPNFSSTIIVIPSSHIHKYSYSYLQKVVYREISEFVIWFHVRNIISSWDFSWVSGVIGDNMSLRNIISSWDLSWVSGVIGDNMSLRNGLMHPHLFKKTQKQSCS